MTMNKDKKLPDTIWKSNLSMENTLIELFFVFYQVVPEILTIEL